MKTILLASLLLLSAASFAKIDANSDWDEIMADNYLDVRAPQVFFSADSYTVIKSIMETCYLPETNEMRTLDEVIKYKRVTRSGEEIFVPIGREFLYTAKDYTKLICGGSSDNHCEWEEVEMSYKLNAKVEVREQATGDRTFGPLLFEKIFNVPNCQ